MTQTKEDISRIIASISAKPYEDVENIVEGVFAVLQSLLIQGDRVEIRGFATFSNYIKAGKNYRDINTGDIVPIPDRLGLKFKASPKLEGAYQAYEPTARRITRDNLERDNNRQEQTAESL
jgi:integration host factor subunit beta